MEKAAFYDTKPYDKIWFDELKDKYGIELQYIEDKLTAETAHFAAGCRAAVIFVNDKLDCAAASALQDMGRDPFRQPLCHQNRRIFCLTDLFLENIDGHANPLLFGRI